MRLIVALYSSLFLGLLISPGCIQSVSERPLRVDVQLQFGSADGAFEDDGYPAFWMYFDIGADCATVRASNGEALPMVEPLACTFKVPLDKDGRATILVFENQTVRVQYRLPTFQYWNSSDYRPSPATTAYDWPYGGPPCPQRYDAPTPQVVYDYGNAVAQGYVTQDSKFIGTYAYECRTVVS